MEHFEEEYEDNVLYDMYFDGGFTGIQFWGREYNLFFRELRGVLTENNIE